MGGLNNRNEFFLSFGGWKSEIKMLVHLVFPEASSADGNKTKPACKAGDPGSIPRWGRSPGGGHDNPLQYSCLGNPMDRGAMKVTVRRSQRVRTTEATEHTQHMHQWYVPLVLI